MAFTLAGSSAPRTPRRLAERAAAVFTSSRLATSLVCLRAAAAGRLAQNVRACSVSGGGLAPVPALQPRARRRPPRGKPRDRTHLAALTPIRCARPRCLARSNRGSGPRDRIPLDTELPNLIKHTSLGAAEIGGANRAQRFAPPSQHSLAHDKPHKTRRKKHALTS